VLNLRSSVTKTVSTISIDDVSVIVTKKRIKHCYIKVDRESGSVCVSVPIGWNAKAVEELVRSKASWIKRKQAAVADRFLNQKFEFNNGELHKVWGSEVPLVNTSNSGRRGVKRSQHALVINAPTESSLDTREKLLTAWYAQEVKSAALALVDKWEPVLGVKAGCLSVQKMKSKWGSCNVQNGNIRLNSELAKFPKGALEHVMVHELVHLLEPSHGKRFYSLMDEFLPNWKALKALTG
jgi:hypothetical protein